MKKIGGLILLFFILILPVSVKADVPSEMGFNKAIYDKATNTMDVYVNMYHFSEDMSGILKFDANNLEYVKITSTLEASSGLQINAIQESSGIILYNSNTIVDETTYYSPALEYSLIFTFKVINSEEKTTMFELELAKEAEVSDDGCFYTGCLNAYPSKAEFYLTDDFANKEQFASFEEGKEEIPIQENQETIIKEDKCDSSSLKCYVENNGVTIALASAGIISVLLVIIVILIISKRKTK